MVISKILYFSLCVLCVFIFAFLVSDDKKNIKYRFLIQLLVIEVVLAFFLLESQIGSVIIGFIDSIFGAINTASKSGIEFVFGTIEENGSNGFVFFLVVLMPIVFVSVLIGLLKHFRILPFVIKIVGTILSKINGMGKLESFNAISSLCLGQSENFIAYKQILGHLPRKVLFTMSATAMSTVSLSILGSYINLIQVKYVLTAIIINIFSTFFVLHIINPYDSSKLEGYEQLHDKYEIEEEKESFFEMLTNYILDGFKVAIIVGAMLIGFVALITMLNMICNKLFGFDFQTILSYVFYPFAWLLNIPNDEILKSAEIMGTKLVSNEFTAMMMMKEHIALFSEHARAVMSVFLVSFANFTSIGVIVGAIQALNGDAAKIVARMGLKVLYGAFFVSFLSAAVVGLIV